MKKLDGKIDPNDKATNDWLNHYRDKVCWSIRPYWKRFLEYTGMTGDQILADRLIDCKDDTHRWEDRVFGFKRWLEEVAVTRDGGHYNSTSAQTGVAMVRGFFAFYRKPLVYRRFESEQLAKSHRKTEDYVFTVDDLKRMAEVADLKERYILVGGKSFGLRAGYG